MSLGLIHLDFGAGASPQAVRFQIAQWAHLVGNMEPIFTDCLRLFEGHLSRVFDSENASGLRGKWKPLSPQYASWKARFFPGNKTLVRTGALRMSLTHSGHPAAIRAASRTGMVYGTSLPWGRYHQLGGDSLPARPLFDWRSDVSSKGSIGWAVGQVAQSHVVAARNEALGRPGIPPSATLATLRSMALS